MAFAHVRPAVATDAVTIAQIQLATWSTAYAGILPSSVLTDATEHVDAITESWRRAITTPPTAQHQVLVAVEQTAARGAVVGFAAGGPPEIDEARSEMADGEAENAIFDIATMMVEPRWGRRGNGSRLLAAIVAHAYDHGFPQAQTWILADDVASRKFYLSAGWALDGGTRTLDMTDRDVSEIRLGTALVPS